MSITVFSGDVPRDRRWSTETTQPFPLRYGPLGGARYPLIGLLGHSHCGKDEAGKFFAAHTNMRFVASSSFYLAPVVSERTGIPLEVLRGPGRHAHKEEMFRIGNEVRVDDPGYFVKLLVKENDIVSGLRNPCEVDYARKHLGVFFLWIDRDVPEDPTMVEFGPTPWKHADARIDNTGTIPEFHERLCAVAGFAGIPVS